MADDCNYLYVMAAIEDGVPVAPCKIGITRNIQSRLSSVQTGHHNKLVVFSAILIPGRQLVEVIEAAAHATFEEYRLEGEWFEVCPVDAAIGCCTLARDTFLELGLEVGQADEAVKNLGIAREIRKCFEFVEHCKANNLPLATRF